MSYKITHSAAIEPPEGDPECDLCGETEDCECAGYDEEKDDY